MRTVGDLVAEVSGAVLNATFIRRIETWPPDVFAICAALLAESGAYRSLVSPPLGKSWPKISSVDWTDFVENSSEEWIGWCDGLLTGRQVGPCPLRQGISVVLQLKAVPLAELSEPYRWDDLAKLFAVHAIADEACANLGLGIVKAVEALYISEANDRLTKSGSLSTFDVSRVRVLPKMRTPQSGIGPRSLSLYAGYVRCEVETRWLRRPFPRESMKDNRFSLLLFPWPFEISADAFAPVPSTLSNMDSQRFGFFDFRPAYDPAKLFEAFKATLVRATECPGGVDAVVLPESAVTETEYAELWRICVAHKVPFLLAGVRGVRSNEARLRIGEEVSASDLIQHKHHRWCLDGSQIGDYGIGGSLNPAVRWWERMDLQKRELTFVTLDDWLTVCHLICEDLARIDPAAQVVRAVGPTLLIALLLDGPQLSFRWPSRYASVFADDPGTSVLTLTAAGMSLRSRPPGKEPKSVIAFWKDSFFGGQEIHLEPGASGVLLTLWAERVREYAADGRHDDGAATRLIYGGVRQLRG